MQFFKKTFTRFVFYFLICPVILVYGLNACSKEQNQNDIPDVAVNFFIYPNSTEYLELNTQGWVAVTGGYRGIIIYRKSATEYMAFERACPHDWDQANGRVEVEGSGLTALCPNCQSKYILLDGTPFEGPTKYPLKQYQTQYDGNQLYIFN